MCLKLCTWIHAQAVALASVFNSHVQKYWSKNNLTGVDCNSAGEDKSCHWDTEPACSGLRRNLFRDKISYTCSLFPNTYSTACHHCAVTSLVLARYLLLSAPLAAGPCCLASWLGHVESPQSQTSNLSEPQGVQVLSREREALEVYW